MTEDKLSLTGRERRFPENEIIVSKTDTHGRLTYVNDVFIEISGFSEIELLGQQHSIIRNPEMPRCVFKLLWDTIKTGKEIFAYVNNRSKNGDNYWVFAHVTPSFDASRQIIEYHSNRRVPKAAALNVIKPLYGQLLEIEARAADRKIGMNDAHKALLDMLADKKVAYDEFVFAL